MTLSIPGEASGTKFLSPEGGPFSSRAPDLPLGEQKMNRAKEPSFFIFRANLPGAHICSLGGLTVVTTEPCHLLLAAASWWTKKLSASQTDLGSHSVSTNHCGILGKELGISKFQVSNLGRNTLQYSSAMYLARSAAEHRAGTYDTLFIALRIHSPFLLVKEAPVFR